MERWWVAALACLGLAGCGEAGLECNNLLPYCALRVELQPAAWEPGTYEFEVLADGERTTCTATLPQAEPAPIECSNPGLRVGFGTSAWWRDEMREPWPNHVSLHDTPQVAEIAVSFEGRELARESFRPRYEKSEPNGKGCGFCLNATGTMEF